VVRRLAFTVSVPFYGCPRGDNGTTAEGDAWRAHHDSLAYTRAEVNRHGGDDMEGHALW